eukprot:TRINITY_DN15869_c0_g3_i4.p2 TRINITY_DN15869_c0_g3~~TRINITY_DN15869_c0_g3_i4.p2  ORF type:complete len:261 (-),score=43.74 TRINITY_DN15869_c0_g3_i4:985-1767(-)
MIEGFPHYQILQPQDANEFYQIALRHFQQNCEDANMLLSIAYKMTVAREESDERYLLQDSTNGKILLLAVRNAPLNVVVGPTDSDEFVIALARYFGNLYDEEGFDLPGIISNSKTCKTFVREYFRLVPKKEIHKSEELLLRALQTYVPSDILQEGKMVLASECEKEMLIEWMHQFGKAVGFDDSRSDSSFLEGMVSHRLSRKAVFLWKIPSPSDPTHYIPVSMIMKALCTESMYRIASSGINAEYFFFFFFFFFSLKTCI